MVDPRRIVNKAGILTDIDEFHRYFTAAGQQRIFTVFPHYLQWLIAVGTFKNYSNRFLHKEPTKDTFRSCLNEAHHQTNQVFKSMTSTRK